MAVLVSDILTRVRTQLVDQTEPLRWSDDELLRHLNDGQRTIAAMQPDAAQKIGAMKMVAGTRQQIPADGISLLNVTRNMGNDGQTPGRTCRIIQRDIIDNQNPGWHSDPKATVVTNYIYDPLDQKGFFVYPPSNGSGYVEINYQYNPADALLDGEISLPDIYLTPLMDYTLFRAHMKDADSAGGQQLASLFLQAFTTFVTGASDATTQDNPNLRTTPFNPSTKATAQ